MEGRRRCWENRAAIKNLICCPSPALALLYQRNQFVLRFGNSKKLRESYTKATRQCIKGRSSLNIISSSKSFLPSPSSPQSLAAEKKSFTFSYPLLAQFAWFLSVFFFSLLRAFLFVTSSVSSRLESLSLPPTLVLLRCEKHLALEQKKRDPRRTQKNRLCKKITKRFGLLNETFCFVLMKFKGNDWER